MVPGILTGQALDQKWDSADLLVLTSRIETYGLVVEALARGIPAVVSPGPVRSRHFRKRGPQTVPRHPAHRPSWRPGEPGGGAARVAHRTDAAALLEAGGARSARYAARVAADGSGGVGVPESPAEVTVDPAGLPPAPPPTARPAPPLSAPSPS